MPLTNDRVMKGSVANIGMASEDEQSNSTEQNDRHAVDMTLHGPSHDAFSAPTDSGTASTIGLAEGPGARLPHDSSQVRASSSYAPSRGMPPVWEHIIHTDIHEPATQVTQHGDPRHKLVRTSAVVLQLVRADQPKALLQTQHACGVDALLCVQVAEDPSIPRKIRNKVHASQQHDAQGHSKCEREFHRLLFQSGCRQHSIIWQCSQPSAYERRIPTQTCVLMSTPVRSVCRTPCLALHGRRVHAVSAARSCCLSTNSEYFHHAAGSKQSTTRWRGPRRPRRWRRWSP